MTEHGLIRTPLRSREEVAAIRDSGYFDFWRTPDGQIFFHEDDWSALYCYLIVREQKRFECPKCGRARMVHVDQLTEAMIRICGMVCQECREAEAP